MKYLLLILFPLLTACGGGECDKACEIRTEEIPRATVDPVKCAENPKLCA